MNCIDCKKPVTKKSQRCKACEYVNRRGKLNVKKYKQKKCMLCGNLNNLNFSQEKIWRIKEAAESAKIIRDAEYKHAYRIRRERERQQKKLDRLFALKWTIERTTRKRLIEMTEMGQNIKRMLPTSLTK